jgi:hypothetical protein
MANARKRLLSRLFIVTATAAAGCGAPGPRSGGLMGSPPSTATSSTSAQRAIVEADVIQLDGGTLYALSKTGTATGTVSVIDVSTPNELVLLGQTTLPGEPFEMYLRGGYLVTMSNAAVGTDGRVGTTQTIDDGAGALVSVVDVSRPNALLTVSTHGVPGEIADSRVVGDVLYLATYENSSCYGCGPAPRTMVTTFNLASPTALRQVEQVSFRSDAPDGYNLPWGSNWKRSIFVTDQRLYIGGHADIDPSRFGTTPEGIIDVLDVTDPTGRLATGARLMVAGAILSRWQLDERGGVLRVISQQGAGRTGNGIGAPQIDTFAVADASTFTPLGHAEMRLPTQEGLRTVRFDGPRAYAITYSQTDPMFVIDLSDPTRPTQRGALTMPGFMYYLEPHGAQVIGLGIDRNDPGGSLNVSLFDVSDADHPRMLSRAPFATPGITEDYEILNSEISEDQDRIGKSFRTFPDGLVVVPFSGLRPYNSSGTSCGTDGGGVQLVLWQGSTLAKQALLPLPGNPRRAFESGGELVTVSDSNVRAFSLANLSVAHETADLVVGSCVPDAATYGGYYGGAPPADAAGDRYPTACAAAPGRPGAGGWLGVALLIGAAVSRAARRRARRA